MTKETALALAHSNNVLIGELMIHTYQLLIANEDGLELPDAFEAWKGRRRKLLDPDGYVSDATPIYEAAHDELQSLAGFPPNLLRAIQERHPDFRFPWES